MKLLTCVIGFGLLMSVNAVPAFADQLALGGDGILYFCSTGGPGSAIVVSTSVGCVPNGGSAGTSAPGTGTFEHPTGVPDVTVGFQPWSLTFPAINPFEFTNPIGGVFSAVSPQNTTGFSWGGNGSVTPITGDITWTVIKDGTSKPQFTGNLLVTGNSNAGLLGSDFPSGATVEIDFTVNLGSNPKLEEVFSHTGEVTSTSGVFSSGEVPAVPEPTSIAFFGTGLLGVGFVLRRKFAPRR